MGANQTLFQLHSLYQQWEYMNIPMEVGEASEYGDDDEVSMDEVLPTRYLVICGQIQCFF